jgi:hypothetical protein
VEISGFIRWSDLAVSIWKSFCFEVEERTAFLALVVGLRKSDTGDDAAI